MYSETDTVEGKTLEEWVAVLPINKANEGLLIASIEDVLGYVGDCNRQYGEHWIKMFSQRYQTFQEKGTTCVRCGAQGLVFLLERQINFPEQRGHFNLYGLRPSGRYVLMTKDHILPKSKGGKDALTNYQTMCEVCNVQKGSNYEPGYIPTDVPALPTLDTFPIFDEPESYLER